ncbi:hypothetical protein Vretimale_17791 [Volvox reticuliferus]|uniref:RING-type domain-containing protein n=1 Tax=Volvox reticuliferus TaxID=1737510 RepID=A0A8J4FW05_9CHLO|nr:hypothetical protein Vretifemale_19014 [Volvox reticuliferus]GIM14926.1 hypothetical protein Vretimale_17791 [Volvox reticuliferus]
MPRTGAPQSASRILNCYVCNQSFPKSEFNTELNEDGHECCPECGSEFVEIIDQAEQASTSTVASGSNVGGQSAARNDPPPGDAGAGGSRSGGASRAPRVEVHAMFHSDSGDAPDMPMSFVDAISRFAPLSLPNGQQAFVLQVQDGALLSPFTMGVPFSDAIAMNPEDWVVGDDLDAVVSRVLDAYMPPRRSTATEVLNTLPRLRVRGGPLSPRPTATLEAAARAATSTPSNPSHLHAPKFSSTDAVASSGGFGCDSGEEDDELARTGRAATSVGGDSAAEARAETIKYSDVLEGRHVDSLAPSTSMAAASASSAPTMAVAPAEAKAMEAKAEVAGDGFASCQPGELCTVCHDAFKPGGEVVELPCRHCFHEDCIMPWLRQVRVWRVHAKFFTRFPGRTGLPLVCLIMCY